MSEIVFRQSTLIGVIVVLAALVAVLGAVVVADRLPGEPLVVQLDEGWNLVTLPADAKSVPASSVDADIVVAYNMATGEYDAFKQGTSPAKYDFDVAPGGSYWIYSSQASSVTFN
jgi:hypothetical protein